MNATAPGGSSRPATRRRRFPFWLLMTAFVLVPLIEIFAIIQVGQVIGAWWTILLLVADSIVGAWLVKREGGRAWRALQAALRTGRMPAQELADGALILVGGTLMLTPGFVTDLFGVALILPFTRPIGRRVLAAIITRRLGVAVGGLGGFAPGGQTRQRPGAGDVVQGEVIDPEKGS